MVSLQPTLDLDSGGFGTYLINLDNDTLTLEYHHNGIVLTYSVVANINMINSLSRYSKAQDFGKMQEFTLIDGYEFYVTEYALPYDDCTILCASKGSLVIFDPAHYYRLAKKFPGKSF